jgi:replication-associated recombination protein RarA
VSRRWSEQRTPNGHRADEASSAMQKALRRGEEREALYFASELELAGFGQYVWRRLRVIVSEDVGLAEPLLPAVVRALQDAWELERQRRSNPLTASIFVVHCVLLLARARKSRLCDHALIALYEGPREPLEVPDHALDEHTSRGRKMGRGSEHFWREAAQLVNEGDVPDPFVDEARAISLGRRLF